MFYPSSILTLLVGRLDQSAEIHLQCRRIDTYQNIILRSEEEEW